MTANVKLNRGSFRKIALLMSEAFDMCEKDTEENGSDNEDVVGEIESAMKHLKQFRSGGSSDIAKKTSVTIDLVRGFGLAMQPDRPMRLASKFLFAIDEMMLNGPSEKPHVVVTYLASHLKYEVSDGRSGSEPYVHYKTNGEGGLTDCDCGQCGTATLALNRAMSGLRPEQGNTIEFLKGE